MKLSNRLLQVASLVKKDATLVDVGCDHGFLPLYLLENRQIKKAYALDINNGPLENVKANAKRYNFDDKIECLLSDGLAKVSDIDFDTVVIAGMGGTLIIEILKKGLVNLLNKELILQANINTKGLRKWLLANNFIISDEKMIRDNDIIYTIIKAQSGSESKYSDIELMYGRINLENKNHLLFEVIKSDLIKYNDIIKKLPKESEKYTEFKNKITLIEEYLNEIERID